MNALLLAILLAGADTPRVEGKPLDPADLPAERDMQPEDQRPSGFWIGHRRARGAPYRWSLLGIGAGVLAITAGGVAVLLRRASRERDERLADPPVPAPVSPSGS